MHTASVGSEEWPVLRAGGSQLSVVWRSLVCTLYCAGSVLSITSLYRLNTKRGENYYPPLFLSDGKTKFQTDFVTCPSVPNLAAGGSHT